MLFRAPILAIFFLTIHSINNDRKRCLSIIFDFSLSPFSSISFALCVLKHILRHVNIKNYYVLLINWSLHYYLMSLFPVIFYVLKSLWYQYSHFSFCIIIFVIPHFSMLNFNLLLLFWLLNCIWFFCNSMYCSPPGLCSWDFPDKNTGMDCHFLLQGIFLTQGSN